MNENGQNNMPTNQNVVNPSTPLNNQSNIGPMPQNPSPVAPIPEVQMVEKKVETPIENISTINNGNGTEKQSSITPPPKNSKKSTILLILLFLFFFLFIMEMPNIQKFVSGLKANNGLSEIEKKAKEEEEKQKQEMEKNQPHLTIEEETKELVCTKEITEDHYNVIKTETFSYTEKNLILTSSSNSKYTFTTPDETYQSLKKECDENSLKYVEHPGYTMNCSYSDVGVEIGHTFNLEFFTPIIDGTTNIQANATYQQDVDTVKTNLISQGYVCE